MRLVLGAALVAILAGSAHAQSASPAPGGASPPPVNPASADGASPAPAVTPPSAVAPVPHPRPDRPYVAPNPVAEFLIGGAAGTVGLFAGAYAGGFAGYELFGHDEVAGIAGAFVGAALGLTTATAAGVALTGSDRDHEGSYGWALLGAAAGATGAAFATSQVDGETAAAFIIIGGAALGATVVFDLTRTRRKPSTAVRLVPLISGGGVQLTLVGVR
jgi:hypothetical protein